MCNSWQSIKPALPQVIDQGLPCVGQEEMHGNYLPPVVLQKFLSERSFGTLVKHQAAKIQISRPKTTKRIRKILFRDLCRSTGDHCQKCSINIAEESESGSDHRH